MRRVNVYVITYGPHRIESEKNVLNRLDEVVSKVKDLDLVVHLCDNNSPKELTDWMKEKFSDNPKYKFFFSEENIGKARIVNHAFKNSRKCDFVCSFDSDMMILSDRFFEELVYALDNTRCNPPIGLACADQKVGSVHMEKLVRGRYEQDGRKYRVTNSGGTAGSCLMIREDLWRKIGGYAEFDNIFGGNDGWVVSNICRGGMLSAIVENAAVDHIGEHTKEYHAWKVKQATTLRKTGSFKPGSGFYDE